jgi:small subunit ribosomal protein S8
MHSDPVADMLTRIRNAHAAGHISVEIPFSTLKLAMIQLLHEQGFIRSFDVIANRSITVNLKYNKVGLPVIRHLKRVSKPGLRVYATTSKLPRVLGGAGLALISTSKGLMSDHQARKQGVGGEVLCYVY